MAEKTRNCTYKHCKNESKEIPLGTEIAVKSRYYHPQCYKETEHIKEIKQLYYDKISNTVVQGLLGKVINDIIYTKNVDSEYFLYCIKFAIKDKINIKSPLGLHYLVDNSRIKNEWKKILVDREKKKISMSVKVENKETVVFKVKKNPTNNGFGNILKRGD